MKLTKYLCSVAVAFGGFGNASAQQCDDPVVPLTAVADACLHEGQPDTNLGTTTFPLRIGSSCDGQGGTGRKRSLIRFDLTLLPNDAIVESATLVVVQTDNPFLVPANYLFFEALAAWEEQGVTWNSQPPTGQLIAAVPPAIGEIAVQTESLRALANDWVRDPAGNHGILVRLQDDNLCYSGGGGDTLASRENVQLAPELWIEYRLPGDLGCDVCVDLNDLAEVLGDFGCSQSCSGDVNRDGETDLVDLAEVLANFGRGC